MKPLNFFVKVVVALIFSSIGLVAFQNCSGQGFDTGGLDLGSVSPGKSSVRDQVVPVDSGAPVLGPNDFSVAPQRAIVISDISVGNGTIVQKINQTIQYVGGANLKGCTTLASNAARLCMNESEYRIMGVPGDEWKYDAASDTYIGNFDVSTRNWPHVEYVSRFILPNGSKAEFRFTPIKFIDSSVGNGTNLRRIKQVLSGVGGANLKGCTTLATNAARLCMDESEFRVMGVPGDDWKYNAATDTYSADFAGTGFPQASYVSRYILPNGKKLEVAFTPANTGPVWVVTEPHTCVGPTVSVPASGDSCSTLGQVVTTNCGGTKMTCM